MRPGTSIPMRDGTLLSGTLYVPETSSPTPAIVTITPYGCDTYHERGSYFASRGYIFASIDARGRGNSEGVFIPYEGDGLDGYDTVEWLAELAECNGVVGMWGGSYAGFNQWDTARTLPPSLATIVPAAAAFPGIDTPIWRNVFSPQSVQWLYLVSGRSTSWNAAFDPEHWEEAKRKAYFGHQPFVSLSQYAGQLADTFEEWLDHPHPDEYWDRYTPTEAQYEQMNLPVLTITGHHDGDQPGALEYYYRHLDAASQKADHYLLIGPWDHAGTRTPERRVGGVDFGEASLLDLNQLHLEWYDWHLRDGAKPSFLESRVAYFVSGLNQWGHSAASTVAEEELLLYLSADEIDANDVYASGHLTDTEPATERPHLYRYDPTDTRPGEIDPGNDWLTTQLSASRLFGSGLVYHSPPLEEPVVVAGHPGAELWIDLDVPDTDIKIEISEVRPDGSCIEVSFDLLRARYRTSLRHSSPVVPGECQLYVFDGFRFMSHQFGEQSRIRIVVRAPNSRYVQRNFNTGGEVALEGEDDARIASVRIHQSPERRSRVRLPATTVPFFA